jgi:hypothetical protein
VSRVGEPFLARVSAQYGNAATQLASQESHRGGQREATRPPIVGIGGGADLWLCRSKPSDQSLYPHGGAKSRRLASSAQSITRRAVREDCEIAGTTRLETFLAPCLCRSIQPNGHIRTAEIAGVDLTHPHRQRYHCSILTNRRSMRPLSPPQASRSDKAESQFGAAALSLLAQHTTSLAFGQIGVSA